MTAATARKKIGDNWKDMMLVVLGVLALHTFNRIEDNIGEMAKAITDLSKQVAVVVTNQNHHEQRLRKLEGQQ